MPAKPKPRAGLHDRAVRSMRAHPWITWSTAASIVTVFAVIIPGSMWFFARFQTVEAAEFYQQKNSRAFAELLYGQARQESLILRNRVNECRSRGNRPQERTFCLQYEQEYREAERRAQFLYQEMQKAAK